MLASLATRVVGKLPSDTASVYQGTSTWEKTIFILSKVDLLTQNEATMRAAFYELGGLFCKSFAHLPNPVPDSIITLSLPHKSRENVPSQLNTLIERLKVDLITFKSGTNARLVQGSRLMKNALKLLSRRFAMLCCL